MAALQLTDAQICKQVFNFGNRVQEFAETHYTSGTRVDLGKSTNPKYRRYLELTTPESPKYRKYLANRVECPKVVAAFIWRVMVYEIFECFHWLGAKPGRNFRELRERLRPVLGEDDADLPASDTDHLEFNMWSSKSVSLLSALLRKATEHDKDLYAEHKDKRIKYIATNILATVGHGTSPQKDVLNHLVRLLSEAWNLDIWLTKDTREFSWMWGTQPSLTQARDLFNPDTDSDWGNKASRAQQLVGQPPSHQEGVLSPLQETSAELPDPEGHRYVRLVVSPALVKTIADQNVLLDKNSRIILLKRLVSLTHRTDLGDGKIPPSLTTNLVDSPLVSPDTSPKKGRSTDAKGKSSSNKDAASPGYGTRKQETWWLGSHPRTPTTRGVHPSPTLSRWHHQEATAATAHEPGPSTSSPAGNDGAPPLPVIPGPSDLGKAGPSRSSTVPAVSSSTTIPSEGSVKRERRPPRLDYSLLTGRRQFSHGATSGSSLTPSPGAAIPKSPGIEGETPPGSASSKTSTGSKKRRGSSPGFGQRASNFFSISKDSPLRSVFSHKPGTNFSSEEESSK